MKIFLYKHFGALRPADDLAEEVLKGLAQSEWVSCEIKKPRNLKHHRKYWKLMSVVAESMEGERSAEDVSDMIKIKIGHTKKLELGGVIFEVPKSISFSALDQIEFAAFYERAIRCICAEFIPGMQDEDLIREVEELIR